MNDISPLFAIEADGLLCSGEPEKAVELCKNGLDFYPDYKAGLIVLARAYFITGNFEKAKEILDDNLINIELESFKNEASSSDEIELETETDESRDIESEAIPKEKQDYSIIPDSSDNSLIPGLDPITLSSSIRIPKRRTSRFEDINYPHFDLSEYGVEEKTTDIKTLVNKAISQDIRPEEIKDKFSELIEVEESKKTEPVRREYTETLANILELQGAFAEALEAYEYLHDTNPTRSDFYRLKILSLKSKI